MIARLLTLASLLLVLPGFATAQDASSYALTPAAAEKFVRATQQMVATNAAPNVQGGVNPADLANVRSAIDGSPAAKQALTAAGLSSSEYVAFMGAAMVAMMVGQMEAAGMRGMLPPGVTARPSQQNVDFMRSNVDLFQRAMSPGATAAASTRPPPGIPDTSDEALPMPAAVGAVLPSSILARLSPLDSITRRTDCTLGGAQATVTTELNKARAQQNDYYGNPGNRGLAHSPAEAAVLERAADTEIMTCGLEASNGMQFAAEFTAADRAKRERDGRIAEEQQSAWAACPGIPGGKEPACERAVEAEAARKRHDSEREFLTAVAPIFAARLAVTQQCTADREALVRDARAAEVRGANIVDVVLVLAVAWERIMTLPAEWQGICESAQRSLLE